MRKSGYRGYLGSIRGAYLLLSVNYGQNPAPGQSLFLREPLRQTHLPANSRRVIPSEVFHASGITYQSFLCWKPLIEQYYRFSWAF